MRSKLGIILLLLFVLNLDGIVLARETNGSSPFNPDGINVTRQKRKRRHRRAGRRRAKVYRVRRMSDDAGMPGMTPTEPMPPPAETPVQAAPPPPVGASPDMSTPRGGAVPAKKAAPRIKPPTVQIKPPTE